MATTKSVTLGNGDVLYYQRMQMDIPQDGTALGLRQCSFFLPDLLASDPVVQATIDPVNGGGASDLMVLFNITVVPNGPETEIKISIQTPGNTATNGTYFCNLTAIGTPLQTLMAA